jgi:hypothetical protein
MALGGGEVRARPEAAACRKTWAKRKKISLDMLSEDSQGGRRMSNASKPSACLLRRSDLEALPLTRCLGLRQYRIHGKREFVREEDLKRLS